MGKRDKITGDAAVMDAIIQGSPFCRLAMAADGAPYVIPLCFGRIGNTLYFHTGLRGKKMDLLLENPRVCFEMTAEASVRTGDSACSFSVDFATVVGFGTARRVEDEGEKRAALDAIVGRYTGGPFVYKPEALAVTAVLAVDIAKMTGKVSGLREKYMPPAAGK